MVLGPGTPAPGFTLSDQFGRSVSPADFRAHRRLVLVFFPLAFSRTCRGELQELRDHRALFEEADAALVGISVDSKHALRAWDEEEAFGFPLLADFWPHGAVARAYDAFLEERGHATRATFVIDERGVIRSSFATGPAEARTLAQYREALSA